MALPVALHLAAASQLLPLTAGLMRRGRPLPAPARWVLAWCGLQVATDAVSLAVNLAHRENLWLQWIAVPLGSGLVLWALSLWQTRELFRLAYRLAIAALALATAAALLLLGPEPMFEQVVTPLHALVLLTASLHTLLARALGATGAITGEPWFWIGMGLSLYFAGSVAIGPFAVALLSSNVEWVRQAYIARAWTSVVAFLLITMGVLCPLFRQGSGGRS